MIPIYFAMPVTHYKTKELQSDIEFLKTLNYIPYVPDSEKDNIGYKQYGIAYFTDLILKKNFKACVFRSFYNGKISAGVATEVICCLNNDIPVLEILEISIGRLTEIKIVQAISMQQIQSRELTIAGTRSMLKLIKEHHILNSLGGPNNGYNTI